MNQQNLPAVLQSLVAAYVFEDNDITKIKEGEIKTYTLKQWSLFFELEYKEIKKVGLLKTEIKAPQKYFVDKYMDSDKNTVDFFIEEVTLIGGVTLGSEDVKLNETDDLAVKFNLFIARAVKLNKKYVFDYISYLWIANYGPEIAFYQGYIEKNDQILEDLDLEDYDLLDQDYINMDGFYAPDYVHLLSKKYLPFKRQEVGQFELFFESKLTAEMYFKLITSKLEITTLWVKLPINSYLPLKNKNLLETTPPRLKNIIIGVQDYKDVKNFQLDTDIKLETFSLEFSVDHPVLYEDVLNVFRGVNSEKYKLKFDDLSLLQPQDQNQFKTAVTINLIEPLAQQGFSVIFEN